MSPLVYKDKLTGYGLAEFCKQNGIKSEFKYGRQSEKTFCDTKEQMINMPDRGNLKCLLQMNIKKA